MHSCDPEKVRICGTEKNIVAVYVNQSGIGKQVVVKRGEAMCQGKVNLSLAISGYQAQ